MKLYHGSYIDINKIDLKKSMKGKDFGQGFYLSADLVQAKNIATIRSISQNSKPVVNVYEFDESLLESNQIEVKRFSEYSKEWAEFVLANRNNKSESPVHKYDIVIGPIANDKVGQQIRKFTEGEISMEEFINRLKFMKGITLQYFFGTEKSLQYLMKLSSLY